MIILYNILQLFFLVLFFPVFLILILSRKKLRRRIPASLGIGLKKQFATTCSGTGPTFWIHALSVGEVTSAIPLITGLKEKYTECKIILSVTTTTGKEISRKLLSSSVDQIIAGPIDLLPVIWQYKRIIEPDIFILVETDFWPNILYFFRRRQIPTLLVNGRVSEQSMVNYSKFRLFFKPMFEQFSMLCMQTRHDKNNMIKLGVTPDKLFTPGNLKFDTPPESDTNGKVQDCFRLLPRNTIIFVAGSTHEGEENILMAAYAELRRTQKNLYLVLVPRNPKRAAAIQTLAENFGMSSCCKTSNKAEQSDILIVDTIGELTHFYSLADIAFVGGSLVEKGGHNPVEPAAHNLPVIFGPNMQDFSEIAGAMLRSGGAVEVTDAESLINHLDTLLQSENYRTQQGNAAFEFVHNQRGVVIRHVDIINKLL